MFIRLVQNEMESIAKVDSVDCTEEEIILQVIRGAMLRIC
jgi:hypothetical protein